ncbi:MAG: hypothetical protein AAFX06_00350 [Planctomycetota bacterium]
METRETFASTHLSVRDSSGSGADEGVTNMDVSKAAAIRMATCCFTVGIVTFLSTSAKAQDNTLREDPATGIVYRQVVRNVPRSFVEQKMEQKETMVYRPETVAQSTPEVRRLYTPITEMRWQPYVQGRWNPFRQPVVAYRQIPETRWQARDEVINRTTWQTRWVAEKRTVQVPRNVVRTTTEQRVDLEPVGYAMRSSGTPASTVAARIRPLQPGTQVAAFPPNSAQPPSSTLAPNSAPQVASNIVGSATSEQLMRSSNQRGMRTNVLIPSGSPGAPLDTLQSGVGVATVPSFSLRR